MFVKDVMTFGPVTVSPETPLREVADIMRRESFDALPVAANGQVKGVITAWDFLRVAAPDNGCDIDTATAGHIMSERVLSISPEEIIEEAAYLMREHDVWALPVLNEDNLLVGIITQADMFRAMVDMMGLRSKGTRITLRVPDRQGVLAEITHVVKGCGLSIASLATYMPEQRHVGNVVLRVKTTEPRDLVQRLRAAGFWITHVSQVWE